MYGYGIDAEISIEGFTQNESKKIINTLKKTGVHAAKGSEIRMSVSGNSGGMTVSISDNDRQLKVFRINMKNTVDYEKLSQALFENMFVYDLGE